MLLDDWPLTEPVPLGALTLHRLHPLEGQKKCPSLARTGNSTAARSSLWDYEIANLPLSRPLPPDLVLLDIVSACIERPDLNYVGCPASQPQGRVPSAFLLYPPADKWPRRLLTPLSQRRGEALKVNISAGEGLQDVLKSNLGPRGTIKM